MSTVSISDKIHFLTGTPEQIAEVATAYRVFYQKVESEKFSDYVMDHSTITYVMGPDGRYVSHFGFDATAEAIVQHLTTRLRVDAVLTSLFFRSLV